MRKFTIIMRVPKALAVLAALATTTLPSVAQSFTQSDLEKMVRELESVAEKHSDYKWPIKCSIQNVDKINAYASMEEAKGTEKPQAIMVLYTGLLKSARYDLRMVRAVIAHEVAHLAMGHVDTKVFRAADLELFMTRQQEHEADIVGAQYLQKLGYSKKDMVDMLMFLDGLRARTGDWLGRLNSDHATPKARAAKIVADPSVLKSLVQFDVGLAYLESRQYRMAADMFEVAYSIQPELAEAYTNRAQAMLQFYWDQLPSERFAQFFRPDFGEAVLTTKPPTIQGYNVTPQNLQQYKEAMDAIELAISKSGADRNKELKAIAQILHPMSDEATVRQGIDSLAALKTTDNAVKFRYVNNQAVGYLALKDVNKAFGLIVNEWKSNGSGNHCAAENLGRFRFAKGTLPKPELDRAKLVLETFLKLTPQRSPSYGTVSEGYKLICSELGVAPMDIKAAGTFLLPAINMVHAGKEIGLFENLRSIVEKAGKAQSLTPFVDKYPDVFNLRWPNGEFAVIGEELQAIRITSYALNDTIQIRAVDETVRKLYEVKVGMAVDDLKQWLNVDAGKVFSLVGKAGLEEWRYFGALNFGVLIDGEKIAGITLTSVYDPED